MTDRDFLPAQKTGKTQSLSRPSLSYWQDAWLRLKKNKQALTSLAIVISLVLFTTLGPLIWRLSPADQDVSRIDEVPSFGKKAMVIDDLPPWDQPVATDQPESPTADAATLVAPSLRVVGTPTLQAVRLQWDHVPGAASYGVYRSEIKPEGTNYGVPISEVDAGNKLGFEDSFNLVAQTYYYTVVAKNGGVESPNASTIALKLEPTITLTAAQSIDAAARVGKTIRLQTHPLGTDNLGRDLLARLMEGGRISLFIGFFGAFLYTLIGVLVGGIGGYFGGRVDAWIVRTIDFVLGLPFLLFTILIRVASGVGPGESGIMVLLFALVIFSWTGPARMVRGQILQLRESEFVQASKLLGAKPLYLVLRHLLPNTLGVIIVSMTFSIPSAIYTEAFLSFIGMGVVPPTASWGSMTSDGISVFLVHSHEFLAPAVVISLTVLAFNLLGDGLTDALDPRRRSAE